LIKLTKFRQDIIEANSQVNRSRILKEIRNVVREQLQKSVNESAVEDISNKLRRKPVSLVRSIRPIKPIQMAKPFMKVEKIKKRWDPDHTGLAWKS